ncbi:conserved protein of unknown function [Nitrospira japonica]|uniref:DUF2946 domain-containing protein n=1 Tax=Nitrospira japonica TaxID=1325564 RepID=A0A1W1I8E5_9BACT|nr:conserved protein of unknown function [Nitrospira japonica]
MVTDLLRYLHRHTREGRKALPVFLLACLLIGIRLIAGTISEACFFDLELTADRTVHLHSANDHAHCNHGRFNVAPLVAWACSVCKDVNAYTLPEVPRLPILVSFFVPLFLLVVSFGRRPLIAAHGRGPPFLSY